MHRNVQIQLSISFTEMKWYLLRKFVGFLIFSRDTGSENYYLSVKLKLNEIITITTSAVKLMMADIYLLLLYFYYEFVTLF